MKMYKLIPSNGRKSFYGKATVIEIGGWTFLKSYNTIVCGVDSENNFHRFWNGWSMTTWNHIRSFQNRIESKKEWDNLIIENLPDFIV